MATLFLTAEKVNKLELAAAGQVIYRDTKLEGFGLRVGSKRKAYFVEKRVDGRTVRHTIGVHGQITAEEARRKAGVKLGELTDGRDLNAEVRRRAEERAAARAERAASAAYTVRALCEWYVKHQHSLGKQSAQDASGMFAKHVYGGAFAELPARDLTAKQATAMIRAVVETGKRRTAAKLRAYLRAAYSLAQSADTNAEAPAALVLFGIETNPIASTAAIKNASGSRDVTLTEDEIGEALRLLREQRSHQHDDALAALELALLLGGQRPTQVLRLTAADVDLQGRTLTLMDSKGRRATARRHVLPLPDPAVELLTAITRMRRAECLFGDKNGGTTPDTVARKGVQLLAKVQANLAARIEQAGRKPPVRPKIEPRDLRRTAETMLAAMGVSKDVRAQLLSHGLGGVQDRHYDQHSYMEEKQSALAAWCDRLEILVGRQQVLLVRARTSDELDSDRIALIVQQQRLETLRS
jgi:integrase